MEFGDKDNSMPPRAAYVHVPFCRHRCGYCNFTLVAGRDDLINSYLKAVEIELASHQEPHEVTTLFFGGGTPTHLSSDQLKRLFQSVYRWFLPSVDSEISMEANPADITKEKVALLQDWGVTRVSLGAQSFAEDKLALLERDHSAKDVRRALEITRERIPQVSLDLIFGVPGETRPVWQRDLESAVALKPDHISTYGLTFEPGTKYYRQLQRGDLASLGEEVEREFYLAAIDQLTAAGFEHYEVSNFAQPERRCRHNQVYWRGQEYFAVGPGAARHIDGVRSTNYRSTTTYLNRVLSGKSPVAEQERLDREARARERLVLGLRMLEGIDCHAFKRATAFDVEALAGEALVKFRQLGLLTKVADRIRLTRQGLLVSDSLWPDLIG